MSKKLITHYRLAWRPETNTGTITLVEGNAHPPAEISFGALDPASFQALSVMLREERPVYFDPSTNMIETGMERVGEDEID